MFASDTGPTLAQLDDIVRSLKPKRQPRDKMTSSDRKSLLLHQLHILLGMTPDLPYSFDAAPLKDARTLPERATGLLKELEEMEQRQSGYRYRQAHQQSGREDHRAVNDNSTEVFKNIRTGSRSLADRVNQLITPLEMGRALRRDGADNPALQGFEGLTRTIEKSYQRVLLETLKQELYHVKLTCMGVHPHSDLYDHFSMMVKKAVKDYLDADGNGYYGNSQPDEAMQQILKDLAAQLKHPDYDMMVKTYDQLRARLEPMRQQDAAKNFPFADRVMESYRRDRADIRKALAEGTASPNPLEGHSFVLNHLGALRWAHAVRELESDLYLERRTIADPAYKGDRESMVVAQIMRDAKVPPIGKSAA